MERRPPAPNLCDAVADDESLTTAVAATRRVLKASLRTTRAALRDLAALEQLLERRATTQPKEAQPR